jgi:PAS domain S-box-containing protein
MLAFAAGWTVSLLLLLMWSWKLVESNTVELARVQARALFQKDLDYRKWNAGHGGVYVPITEKTQPNLYLHVPEKNVETTSGRKLTLMNPAYMNRQVYEGGSSQGGATSRLTSLRPIRPDNAPDAWERKALEAFEKGVPEMGAVQEVNGRRVYRYMAPFLVEEECLQCHEGQGYQVGDVRGGISVTVPMESYLEAERGQKTHQAILFAAVWFLGMAGMSGAFYSIKIREKSLAQYQQELRSRNHFLQTVLDSIQDGISVLDRDLTIRMTNRVMEEWYEDALPLAGKKCHEAYHGRQAPCDPCPVRRALETGSPAEDLVPGPSGTPIQWLELHAYPLKDPETGEVQGVVEFVRDVTRRIETEEELRRIGAAVRQAQNFIVITDAEGRILYANPYFEKYTGFTLDQVRGKLPLVLQSIPDGERVLREEILPRLREGRVWTRRMHAFIRDGSQVHVDLTASPVLDNQGRLMNIVFVARDVTREKQLESQLVQAQKMESVGQLAGGVAHDFNNLLQVMNGYTELLLARMDPSDPLRTCLEKIRESGERAASLIQQLLAFSRRQVLQPQVLDLNRLIENLLKMLGRVLGEHIAIRFLPGDPLDFVYADRTMVEQVILNLSVNARDAMPEGGELVMETGNVLVDEAFCKKHPWAKPGRYVLLSVSDTGHGMTPETLERIFDPFFTTKELGRGTGLGLSTVYGIVKQHDGMIHVYSEPGLGTTFKVYLPKAPEDAYCEVEERPAQPVEGGDEVILVAEDSDEVRRLVSETLREFGYTVVEAGNGREVLSALKSHPGIQLVILDVVMPEKSGWQAYQELQRIRPDMPVLFMSGYSENVVHADFVLKSGCRLIQKPFPPSTLLAEVRKALGKA